MAILVWWIGVNAAEGELMETVRTHLQREFDLPVSRSEVAGRPEGAFDPRRGQHSSSTILRWLVANRPPEARKILGVTDVDLFMPILTFVFGEAQLDGAAAVVSTARLTGEAVAAGPKLLAARLAKECVHELGHTFGLLHCSRPRCVMARSTALHDVDSKASTLCPDCRVRYQDVRPLTW